MVENRSILKIYGIRTKQNVDLVDVVHGMQACSLKGEDSIVARFILIYSNICYNNIIYMRFYYCIYFYSSNMSIPFVLTRYLSVKQFYSICLDS